jgi:hypothetical protein
MKHNLIIYDMTFAKKYNVNSIIDVLIHGYGFKCHYLKKKKKKLSHQYYANIHPMVIIIIIIKLCFIFIFSSKLT